MVLYFLLEIVSVVLAIILIFIIIKGKNDFSNNKYKKMFFCAIGLAVILFIVACLEINREMRVDARLHIILCLVYIFIGLVSFCKMRK